MEKRRFEAISFKRLNTLKMYILLLNSVLIHDSFSYSKKAFEEKGYYETNISFSRLKKLISKNVYKILDRHYPTSFKLVEYYFSQ